MKLSKEEIHEIIKRNLHKLEVSQRVLRKIQQRKICSKDVKHCILYGVPDSVYYERKGIIIEIRLGSLKKKAKRSPLVSIIFLQLTQQGQFKAQALMSSYRKR